MYMQLSLVCRCSVGMPSAALHVRAMTLCLKCALDVWILVFFVSDSRTCGSVASESGSCQRQGTVGKRTQNWRYPTCGHGNIDWSIVGCDESTELSRLTFVFKGQKSIGKRLFHYQTPCNLCLYGLSLFHLVITMVLVVLSLKHQTFQGEKNKMCAPHQRFPIARSFQEKSAFWYRKCSVLQWLCAPPLAWLSLYSMLEQPCSEPLASK